MVWEFQGKHDIKFGEVKRINWGFWKRKWTTED